MTHASPYKRAFDDVQGAVNSEVVIQLAGGLEVVSVITKTSSENLGLKEGKEVYEM